MQHCLENKSYLGCDLPFLSEDVENEDCFQACEESRRNDGQVNSDCEPHGAYIGSSEWNNVRNNYNMIQQKVTVEEILIDDIEPAMDPQRIRHATGNGGSIDNNAGDCRNEKIGIDCQTSTSGGTLMEKVSINGIPMDMRRYEKKEKSKGDASCFFTDELVIKGTDSESAVDSECVFMDKPCNCGEKISKRDCAGCHCSESKTVEVESNESFCSEMLWSGHTVKSSNNFSAVRKDGVDGMINCSDSEAPSRSVADCQDNDSSDEDIEEIVYKGEME